MWDLLSLNINGLNDRMKRTALVDWLKCMKVDVACLQETHAPSHESIRKWFANSGFRVVSSSVSNKRCGSALLIPEPTARSAVPGVSPGRGLLIPHGYLHPGKCEHSEV